MRGRERGGWISAVALVHLFISVLALACDDEATASSSFPLGCRSDADCSGWQCESVAFVADNPASRRLLFIPPCTVFNCTSDEQCPGEVCQDVIAVQNPRTCPDTRAVCAASCDEAGCPAGWSCAEDGHCEIIACTDPQFGGCPENWHCDTEAAAAAPTGPDALLVGIASSEYYPDVVVADATGRRAGCRVQRCDEAGAPSCGYSTRCQPELTEPNSNGCYVIPCDEGGGCSDDDFYICEPTSSNPRPETVDNHGCVAKNCEEGVRCFGDEVCDFDLPNHDMHGCGTRAPLSSSLGGPCAADRDCLEGYCVHRVCSANLGQCQAQ